MMQLSRSLTRTTDTLDAGGTCLQDDYDLSCPLFARKRSRLNAFDAK